MWLAKWVLGGHGQMVHLLLPTRALYPPVLLRTPLAFCILGPLPRREHGPLLTVHCPGFDESRFLKP